MATAARLIGGLLVLLYLWGVGPVAAQERSASQLQVRAWTEDDGLPSNAVASLHQGPDGFMWVGTESGLARFDGARFYSIGRPGLPLYTSIRVLALSDADSGEIRVGTTTGLIRWRPQGGQRWDGDPPVLGGVYVESLLTDRSGLTWIGTTGEGLFVRTGKGKARRVTRSGFDPQSIRDIAPASQGFPWAATDLGLARVTADTVLVPVAGGEVGRDARSVLEDSRGRVWVGTREGLFRLVGDRLVRAIGPPANTLVRALVEDENGHVWAGSSGHGIYRLVGERWDRMGTEHGLPSDDIHAMATDRRGDLWVGTSVGVAVVYQGDVLPITTNEGLAAPIALPVMEDRSGALWVGSFGGGVTRIRNGQARVFGRAEGLPHDVVLSLAEDSLSRAWIGTRTGVRIFDGTRLVREPTGVLDAASVPSLLATSDGSIWAGTTDGVYVIRGDSVRSFGRAEGLGAPHVIGLTEARDGSVLVGTEGGGAYRIRNDSVQPLIDTGKLPASVVYDFRELADGTIWIGGGDGLVRLRGDEHVSLGRLQGIPDPSTARILEDATGNFWISTNHGVYRVPIAELDSVADGMRASISPRVFTARDGMPSSETNGGFYPAGWKGRGGRLFFPTMEGVAVFDPSSLDEGDDPLSVLIEGVETSPINGAPLISPDLPPDVRDLAIAYTAIDFRHGDLAEFRYRLFGYDTAWVFAGSRRTAYYTHLSPGAYTFVVEGRLPGQEWYAASPFRFRIRPFFYETWWFRLAGIALALLLILALHRWRVHVLRQREIELLRLVRARESAERRYREIFENAREVVITLDADGRIVEANREASQVLDRDSDELVGASFDELAVQPEAGEGASRGASQRIREAGGLLEIPLRRRDGTTVSVEASIRELQEHEQLRGYQLIARDVTERNVLEERLRQSQRMEAVGLLAGGVAHDFNNILNVISGYTTLILQGLDPDDPLREDAKEISEAADRAAALTLQLLAFSRRQTLRPRVIQLNDIVAAMEKLLRRLIGEDIDFVVGLAPNLRHVRADPGQMEQVITNLVVNARDAMPNGGQLLIETRNRRLTTRISQDQVEIEPGEYVMLAVTDTGAGMTPEVRERVFEPFFTTKPTGKGTGLGLSTVYGIVEQSGGHVRVESAPGKGSTFELYLPAATGPVDVAQTRSEEPGGATGDETILVVDDEESIRRLVCRILEKNGYRVLVAASPLDALSEVVPGHAGEIHLLLSDVVMPQMNGPDFADRMVRSHPRMKTIFMSGYADEKLASRVITHSLLRKPFTPAELLRKVREVLEE
jgi:PAS domain S-box-containing protein